MCFSHLGVFLISAKPLTTENTESKTTPKIYKITVCLIPFRRRNSPNSALMNCGPLSFTTVTGKPKQANTSRKAAIVAAPVVEDIGRISRHLEWATTITKKSCPSLVAKSACTRYHGFPGRIHGVNGAAVSILAVSAGNLCNDEPKFRCLY